MKSSMIWFCGVVVLLASCMSHATVGREVAADGDNSNPAASMYVYIGTYASEQEDGVFIFRLDMKSGELSPVGAASGVKNPSFQAIHPNARFLYSVSESQDFKGKRSGAVAAFAINPETGQLRFLNAESAVGTGTCHVTVDPAGTHVLAANYGSGSVVVLPIRADGTLGTATSFVQHVGSSVDPRRQKQPHAHCVAVHADNQFVVSADLGIDKLLIYRYDHQRGMLTPNPIMPAVEVEPGAGPRHFAFHPCAPFGYVINELNSTVTAFRMQAERGELTPIQSVSALPPAFEGRNWTAEIAVSPDGRFLYGSNRGHNSIAVFSVESKTGKLTPVSHVSTQGEVPRGFAIDPTGSFLVAANQQTGNVVVFRIDSRTGLPTPTGHAVKVPQPVCVSYVPRT